MSPHGLPVEDQQSCHGIKAIPARSFPAYKERNANSAPKIRLATMASHNARDGLSPRALLMWLVIMMQLVSASQSQSQNIPDPSWGNVAAAGN